MVKGCKPNSNLAAPRLAEHLGNEFFGGTGGEYSLAFIAAVGFATILAVAAGSTLASGAFSHDFYGKVIRTHIRHSQVSDETRSASGRRP